MLCRSSFLAGLLPAALFVLTAFPAISQETGEEAGGTTKAKLPSIVVTEAVERPLTDKVVATGTIRPVQEVYVQPLVDGLSIRSLDADIGDSIEKDAVLATPNDHALIPPKRQLQPTRDKAKAARKGGVWGKRVSVRVAH